jgi:hypothetical protein
MPAIAEACTLASALIALYRLPLASSSRSVLQLSLMLIPAHLVIPLNCSCIWHSIYSSCRASRGRSVQYCPPFYMVFMTLPWASFFYDLIRHHSGCSSQLTFSDWPRHKTQFFSLDSAILAVKLLQPFYLHFLWILPEAFYSPSSYPPAQRCSHSSSDRLEHFRTQRLILVILCKRSAVSDIQIPWTVILQNQQD